MQTTHVEASHSITMKPGFIATATNDLSFSAKIVEQNNNPYGADDYNVYGITYDANGNIQTLNRNKNTVNHSNEMDKLDYKYDTTKPNRLKQIVDTVTKPTGVDDIKTQATNNYEYNEIGQLTKNNNEDVEYEYNASGLVTNVKYKGQLKVQFIYDDKGKRIQKKSYTNGALYQTTTYVRDASGNPMAIYEDNNLKELPIYGASRLGLYYKSSGTSVYQLTDHLGSVRAVISKNGNHAAALVGNTDYYPFGIPMPNRQTRSAYGYRYEYQGQEKDPETGKEAFELRLWDSRIGRWLTTDPAGQYSSPYLGMGNNPVSGIDHDGAWVIFPTKKQSTRVANNINSLFKSLYGIENAISVKKRTHKDSHFKNGLHWVFGYVSEYEETGYYLEFDTTINLAGLDEKAKFLVESFRNILNAPTIIYGELAHPTKKPNTWAGTLDETKGFTVDSRHFLLPNNLPDYDNLLINIILHHKHSMSSFGT